VICLIDTPGAYPANRSRRRRGQAQVIAESMFVMSRFEKQPIILRCDRKGGFSGALGHSALGDRVAVMQHAYYSVISPEGCRRYFVEGATEARTQGRRRH